jgi:acyl carrier protein
VLDWDRDAVDLAAVSSALNERQFDALEVLGIPDARVDRDLKTVELANDPEGPTTVGELKKMSRALSGRGIDLERLWRLASERRYQVDVRLSRRGSAGRIDALFSREGSMTAQAWASDADDARTDALTRTYSHSPHANKPLAAMQAHQQLPVFRSFLRERLPEYMIPAAFVLVDCLPRTPQGKLDRHALPSPDHARPELAGRYVGPRTPIEKRLVEIEEGLLGLSRIGVHDNFFTELGGHSLLATQLISRIRDALGVELGLRQIFDTPTVALLAEAVSASSGAAAMAAPPIRPASDRCPDIERLSDDEVESLLQGLIRERERHE